jgi:hypothetical protein
VATYLEIMTLKEVSEILRVHPKTVYKLVSNFWSGFFCGIALFALIALAFRAINGWLERKAEEERTP